MSGSSRFCAIRLELEGGPGNGYAFTAPLTADGRIDAGLWRRQPERCTVRRFRVGDDERHGRLVLTRSRRWTFQLAQDNDPQDDESGWRENAHRFAAGARVALTGQDGVTRTYVVVAIEPA